MSVRLFSSFIIKTKKPCINCIHYIKYKYYDPYDEIYETEIKSGKCSRFGKQHLVTGEIEYDYALIARMNEDKCSKIGKYYLENDKK